MGPAGTGTVRIFCRLGGRIKEFGLQLKSKGFAAEQVCWLAADGSCRRRAGSAQGKAPGARPLWTSKGSGCVTRAGSVTRFWDYSFSRFRSDVLFQGRKLKRAVRSQGHPTVTRPRSGTLPAHVSASPHHEPAGGQAGVGSKFKAGKLEPGRGRDLPEDLE